MDWRRIRHLASGALLAGSLCSGAAVGSVVLLGRANHAGDPVGRLSAHLGGGGQAQSAAVAGERGARALALHPPGARGARAVVRRHPATAVHVAAPASTATTRPATAKVAGTASATTGGRTTSQPATTVTIVAPAKKKPASSRGGTTPVTTTPVTTTAPVTTTPATTTRSTRVTQPPDDDWTQTRTGVRRTTTEPVGQSDRTRLGDRDPAPLDD
jgi:hypothetical protein